MLTLDFASSEVSSLGVCLVNELYSIFMSGLCLVYVCIGS